MSIFNDIFGITEADMKFIEKRYRLLDSKLEIENLGEISTDYLLYLIYSDINLKTFGRVITLAAEAESIEDFDYLTQNENYKKIYKAQGRISNFNPHINCLTSKFNNEIDEADLDNLTIEQVAQEVYEIL